MKRTLIHLFILSSLITLSQNQLAIPDTLSGASINMSLKQGTVAFFPGQVTNTYGSNGNILGPTLILRKNFNVTINVGNQLPDTTTIHWHGMHVSALNDGGPHVTIPPTTTWSPSMKVLDWAGTYWYHPHLHMRTNTHVQKGIAGMIIVKDSLESQINLPRKYGKDDFPVVIQSKAFDANNQIIVESPLDTTILVNGTHKPYVDLPAQVVRLRLLNGSSERIYNLGFTGNKTFYQIASDGGLLTAPLSMTRLKLAPGERAEVLIDLAPFNTQSFYLMSFGSELASGQYGAAQPGMGAGQVIPSYSLNPLNGANFNILKINVVNAIANPVTSIPVALVTHTPWLVAQATTTRVLTFMAQNMGPTAIQGPFMINNAMFDMNVINYQIPFNNVEVWQLTNQTPIAHPFHIHDVQFYVLDINGTPPPANQQGRKDVILVPAGNTTVRFIAKFETFYNDTMPFMYHCHMLTHEDMGMMGQFIVQSPPGVGIKENLKAESKQLILFPVPAKSELVVRSKGAEEIAFEIYDMKGTLILKSRTSGHEKRINTEEWENGIYLLRTEDHEVLKFIKQ